MSCSVVRRGTGFIYFFFIIAIADYSLLTFSIITTGGSLFYACSHLTSTLWTLVARRGENSKNEATFGMHYFPNKQPD